jgi:hypothetical protein
VLIFSAMLPKSRLSDDFAGEISPGHARDCAA